jgi:hypothetical protein
MTSTIERNPDVNLDAETIPRGCYLHEGKQLMISARAAKIPFGIATRRIPCANSTRIETVGIIIREEHRHQFEAALHRKHAKNAKYPGSR